MPPILDCSAVMTWCFDDEKSDYSDSLFTLVREQGAIVPAWFFLEVMNTILVGQRRNRLTKERAALFLEMLDSLEFTLEFTSYDQCVHEILELAQSHDLSAYDAAYLRIALVHRLPLATLDRALQRAAPMVGVTLLEF